MSANLQGQPYPALFKRIRLQRGLVFGVIIITALFAFETFNYSTTDYALSDLLGSLSFMGLRWSTILAIAFCGIDFAGIARLFSQKDRPQANRPQAIPNPNETWYLFGAWLLAATMNAMLTWWGVSLAVLNHQTLGNAVIARETLLRIVPIFVAVLVWLIRVLIIGTFSVTGDQLFSLGDSLPRAAAHSFSRPTAANSTSIRPLNGRTAVTRGASLSGASSRSAVQPNLDVEPGRGRPEPTYHPLSTSAPLNSTRPVTPPGRPPSSRSGSSMR